MSQPHTAPEFVPCKQGLLRVRCGCGWTSPQKFKSLEAAETFWSKHVSEGFR